MDNNELNYIKILKTYYPMLKEIKELGSATEPMTRFLKESQQSAKPLVDSINTTKNLTSGQNELIKTRDLKKIGLDSRAIANLINDGLLERVKQGYYRLPDMTENDSDAKLISQLYPDGVICMTTALFYYGYSDRTPLTWDIAIDRNVSKARFHLEYPYVKPYYMDKKHLAYGVTEAEYEDCTLNIFDRDRLICECIKHENKIDRETYNKAIMSYIADNQKNIANLLDYAKKRNLQTKVRERIEVWL